jgi:hypothetical protein
MKRRVLVLFASVLVLGAAAAVTDDTVIEVLPVRNRPAADLVPALQAVLGAAAAVTAFNNRLIVNAPRPRADWESGSASASSGPRRQTGARESSRRARRSEASCGASR